MAGPSRPDPPIRLALRVAGVYAGLAVLWILFSSTAVGWLGLDPMAQARVETWKGLAFVVISAALIFLLVRSGARRASDAEQNLRLAEERQRHLLAGVRDHALFLLDADGRVTAWHPGAERVFGWPADEIIGEDYARLFPAAERAAGEPARWLEFARQDGVRRGEPLLVRRDGSGFPTETAVSALRRPDGTLFAFAVSCHDLATPRAQLAALEAAQMRLARTQAHARIGYWARDLATDRLDISDSLHDILGVPRAEWGGNFAAFFERVHPDDRAQVGRAIQQAYEDTGQYDVRFRILRPDGEQRVLDAMGQVEFDAARRPLRVWGTALDITAHHRAREALEQHRAQLAGVLDTAMDAIVSVDAGHRIVRFNKAAERLFGVAADSVLGADLDRFIPADVRPNHHRGLDAMQAGQAGGRIARVRGLRADGSEFAAEASVSKLELGGTTLYTAMLRDISERERAAAQLRDYAARLQRLSLRVIQVQEQERRHIARELHDEIGQTLTAAKLRVKALGDLPGTAETVQALDHVLQQVRSLSLNLRPSMLDDLGLPATLRWYLGQQGLLGRFTTELELHGVDGRLHPEVETTAFRIVQEAMTNVLRHAAASRVVVRVSSDASQLTVEVEDDGLGFDTRANHLSFGLQGMRERAALIGGSLQVDSAPDKGTRLRAVLPCEPRTTEDAT